MPETTEVDWRWLMPPPPRRRLQPKERADHCAVLALHDADADNGAVAAVAAAVDGGVVTVASTVVAAERMRERERKEEQDKR